MGQKSRERMGVFKSIYILSPIIYDFLLSTFLLILLRMMLMGLVNGAFAGQKDSILSHSGEIAVYLDGAATLFCGLFFCWLYRKEREKTGDGAKKERMRVLLSASLPLAGVSASLALFLNLLFTRIDLSALSDTYESVSNIQYSVPFVFGMLNYGVIKPIEEELVFRGLVYGRMRRYFPAVAAIPVSAMVFGAYHGNMVQLIYGFLMGCLLAWSYERFQTLKASILVHGAANIAVYAVSTLVSSDHFLYTFGGLAATGLITAIFVLCLNWKKVLPLLKR
ncbi:MAG: CPBP family intramembrane metalloprotease [Lachnospiraceae bacterium]|nr:CPBP family intramembrane metalloprotease [Lachnospiraceae bacterium]